MTARHDRREFIRSTAAVAALAGLGDLGFLSALQPISAQEARIDPIAVRLRPEIEPLVRLIEETPRATLLETVAGRIQSGTTYPEVLSALLLAGVRNIQPRPNVGFKFHAVLVVNSAHLASQASPDSDRWLPIFWALDYFKEAQERDVQENNWTMAPVDEAAVPPARRALAAFTQAMDAWDEPAADTAIASLARHAGAAQIYEPLFRYGARDFRSIGHKAIYVANSYRTLQAIGWQHAEPVLRSLAYALLMHEGDSPAQRDDAADRPWRLNLDLARGVRPDWTAGTPDEAAASDLRATLRSESPEAAARLAAELLNRGTSPRSIWDALFQASAELLIRQPGIVALHAVTTTNALHQAFQVSGVDDTRLMLLLQNAAFVPLFRQAMAGRGALGTARIDTIEPHEAAAPGPAAIEAIFSQAAADRSKAVGQTLAYLEGGGDPSALLAAARRLVFLKGNDAHDYKFSSAVFEDYQAASPACRNRYLAASLMLLPHSGTADNELVQRTRSALS
jgi:hypothetical protein